MASGEEGSAGVSPDEAFAVLGDETRLGILEALGRADGPVAFSELFDRVDYDTTANFSYHLEKLLGHFVERSASGYTLRRAGSYVVEAVLSGAVTEVPTRERTPVDEPCFRCGGTMEVSYGEEAVGLYCRDCGGTRGGRSETATWADDPEAEILGHVYLPPAGVHDRTREEILRAAEVWTVTEAHALVRDVCPRCSATLDHTVEVCADHDADGEPCPRCDQLFAVTTGFNCRNCILGGESIFTVRLLAAPELMAFMIDHGIDPIAPEGFHVANLVDETVTSTDPFEAEFTFRADDETATLSVDDELSVVDTTRRRAEPALAEAVETD